MWIMYDDQVALLRKGDLTIHPPFDPWHTSTAPYYSAIVISL